MCEHPQVCFHSVLGCSACFCGLIFHPQWSNGQADITKPLTCAEGTNSNTTHIYTPPPGPEAAGGAGAEIG